MMLHVREVIIFLGPPICPGPDGRFCFAYRPQPLGRGFYCLHKFIGDMSHELLLFRFPFES